MIRLFSGLLLATAVLALGGCDWMPGKPKQDELILAPAAVTNFQALYRQNCAGCHGVGGHVTGSIPMDDPTYLAILPRETLSQVIANGVPGTLMPAFAQSHGGALTDKQVKILVEGIESWRKEPQPTELPAYSAPPGDPAAGKLRYEAYVDALKARTGDAGATMFADGFLANPAFLGLTSDQHLRTLLIVGRPELGIPGFRDAIPGQPLTNPDLAHMVAWLISQRKNEFGQPLAAPLATAAATPEPSPTPDVTAPAPAKPAKTDE